MMDEAPITVIVPAYNAEKYIKKCLDSIMRQTFSAFELIAIDDGSTDSTGSIIDNYVADDQRMIVIHQKNLGVSASRQKGIQLAKGTYIAFVDSDDFIADDYLETLYINAVNTNADIVISFCQGSDKSKDTIVNQMDKNITFSTCEQSIVAFMDNNPNIMHMLWAKLIKRKLFSNEYFPTGRIFEDTAVIYRLLGRSEKTVFLNYDGYFYYLHAGSITKEYTSIESIDRVKAYYELVLYIKERFPELTQKAVDTLYSGANGSMRMIAKDNQAGSYLINQIQSMIRPFHKEISFKRRVQRILILYMPFIYKLL